MEAGIWGRCSADWPWRSALMLSWAAPDRLPMVVESWVEALRTGDRGGLSGRGGASAGGSSTFNVVCEGVWLLDERWVTVGEAATRIGQRGLGCQLIIQSALMLRSSYWAPGTDMWPRRHRDAEGHYTQIFGRLGTAHTRRSRRGRLRRGRGRELGSSDHVAMRWRRSSPMGWVRAWRGRRGVGRWSYNIARCSDGIGRRISALGSTLHCLDVCAGRVLTV